MDCPVCKIVDMQVTQRDSGGRPQEWTCPKCGAKKVREDKPNPP